MAPTGERGEGSPERGQGGVVLRLELDPGDPLVGSIAVAGRPEKRFRGWIELMAAVNTVRNAGEARGKGE